MSFRFRASAAVGAFSLFAAVSNAAILTTANQSVWNYYLATGALVTEVETFNSYANGFHASPFSGSTNSVVWTATADGGLLTERGALTTMNPTSLTITFSPGVRAVAGNFFGMDVILQNTTVLYSVKLSDGSGFSDLSSGPSSFAGFFSTTAATISNITISVTNLAGGSPVYPAVDNLYFGVPVPAPGALALVGFAGLAARRRRR